MAYQLLDHQTVVQVFGPTLSELSELCTIASSPSGSVLIRTIPKTSFDASAEIGLLTSLSDAVESLLQEDYVTAAAGTQGLDANNLVYDAVTFTVQYVPPYPTPGTITSQLQLPVGVITIDTQFGSFLTGPGGQQLGSAADQLVAEYNRLKQIAGG